MNAGNKLQYILSASLLDDYSLSFDCHKEPINHQYSMTFSTQIRLIMMMSLFWSAGWSGGHRRELWAGLVIAGIASQFATQN